MVSAEFLLTKAKETEMLRLVMVQVVVDLLNQEP
jgi:hypothetical protein